MRALLIELGRPFWFVGLGSDDAIVRRASRARPGSDANVGIVEELSLACQVTNEPIASLCTRSDYRFSFVSDCRRLPAKKTPYSKSSAATHPHDYEA